MTIEMKMATAIVCGQWELPLRMEDDDTSGSISGRSYFHFVQSKANDLSSEAICYQYLCEKVGHVESAVEFFGGIGMTATVIDKVCCPSHHLLMDHSESCCRQLRAAFPRSEVECGDSYEKMGVHTADLVCLDYNTYTIKSWVEEDRQSTQTVMSLKPRAIILTDSACSKLHLNSGVYSKLTGQHIETWNDYVQAWGVLVGPEYCVTHAAKQSGAAYLLFQRRQANPEGAELFECPNGLDGFRVGGGV